MSEIIKQKILFIVNPISGGRSKTKFQEMVKSNLDHSIFDPSIKYTKRPEHASQIAREAILEGINTIIAVGGDGTVNEVAKELIHKDIHFGIIPFGSGNGLARHMGIPMNPSKAIQKLNTATVHINDAGTINDMPFFCTCGMGFDAHIGKIFSQIKGRGFSGYAKAVLGEFAKYKAQRYIVQTSEGRKDVEAFLITFANASQYGNNAYIAPKADVTDGKLDICILKPFPVISMPGLVLRVFNKSVHNSSLMDWSTTKNEINITRSIDAPVHIDGEPFDLGKEIKITILPKALKILI